MSHKLTVDTSSPVSNTKTGRQDFNSPQHSKIKPVTRSRGESKTKSSYAMPGSPIASASRPPKVTITKPKLSIHQQKLAAVKGHRRKASTNSSIDYNDPNNKLFSPGQFHENDSRNVTPTKDRVNRVEIEHQKIVDKATEDMKQKIYEQEQEIKYNDEEEYDEYEEFDPFLFIKHLPALSSVIGPSPRTEFCIPSKAKLAPPVTLCLDLDETLVHCSIEPIENPELKFAVTFNGVDYDVYVRTRPYLESFLREVSQWFEIIVFTASQQVYADKLLDILDPEHKYIQHRVFRESCVNVDGNYLKDLTVLGRDLQRTAIVDNSVQAFGFQLNNGIPIESWFDDENDTELLQLLPFLKQLKSQEDVRPLIKKTFGIKEFIKNLPM